MWVLVSSLDHQVAEPNSYRGLHGPVFLGELATAIVIAASLFRPKAASVNGNEAADAATGAADAATRGTPASRRCFCEAVTSRTTG